MSNTYVKLIKPPMFDPADGGDVVFRVEASADLAGLNADLIVDGDYYANGLSGRRVLGTQVLNELEAGAAVKEFTIPARNIGTPPTPEQEAESVMAASGKMRAYVIVYNSAYDPDTGQGVIAKSGEIYVDMLIMLRESDFKFFTPDGGDMRASGSSYTVRAYYTPRNAFGSYGSTDIASYRFLLYDSTRRLIDDSGELFDWNSVTAKTNIGHTFRGLADGRTYCVSALATLGGGYTLRLEYAPLYVDYREQPVFSERLTLKSVTGGVRLTLDTNGLDFSRFTVTREEENSGESLLLADIYGGADSFTDGYAVPERTYIYTAAVYDGDTLTGTYSARITHVSDCLTVSDILGTYTAAGSIELSPVKRADRGGFFEAMDSRYPCHVINGAPDYETGRVSGVFTKIEDCMPVIGNASHSAMLRAWLSNGRAKLLTSPSGQAWVIAASDISSSDPDGSETYVTTFTFTQLADADETENYAKLGLV